MTAPRDWDKELAKIDKAIDRLPAGGAPAPAQSSLSRVNSLHAPSPSRE